MKWYLLTQLAFWIQQIFTVNIEERRKDFYHMLSHHVLTSALLSSAYIYRFYNVANVVLSLMDIVDFLLPVSRTVSQDGNSTNSLVPGSQDSQIFRLRKNVQCRLCRADFDMARYPPHSVSDALLVHLPERPGSDVLRMLQRQNGAVIHHEWLS